MRVITALNLDLTTHCDRRCRNCCCGIGINRKLRHHPWSYFVNVAPFIQGLDRVNLTGGEPTLHPQFADFVPRFKALFGCRRLTLQTDGFRIEQHASVIRSHIDEVYFSHYATPKADDDLYLLDRIMPVGGLSIFRAGDGGANFVPRDRRGSGRVCERGTDGLAAYADGLFYGCCVAPGVGGAVGIEPSMDWRDRILDVPLPCGDCWFSP